MQFLRNTAIFWGALAIGLLGLALSQRYYGEPLLGWDAQFYYATTHSLWFDRDLDITNNLTQTRQTAPFDRFEARDFANLPRNEAGRVVSKYPIGLSLVQLPLLALGSFARAGAERLGSEFDHPPGFSQLEITIVAVGLLMLVAWGLQSVERSARRFVSPPFAFVAVLSGWLGTSLFAYSAIYPFMAHGVGFALVALQLALCDRDEGAPASRTTWLSVGLLGALLLLTRPQAVIVTPLLLAASLWRARLPLHAWAMPGLLVAVPCVLAIFLQMFIHAEQTGHWTFNAYATGGEGFRWFAPQWSMVLWSAGRGLLLYSPLVAWAAIGYAVVPPQRSLAIPAALAVFMLLEIYLVASWSSPEQGDAFGMRMACECVPAVILGVALLLSRIQSGWQRWLAVAIIAVSVAWTNVMLLLYLRAVIPGEMNYQELGLRLRDLF